MIIADRPRLRRHQTEALAAVRSRNVARGIIPLPSGTVIGACDYAESVALGKAELVLLHVADDVSPRQLDLCRRLRIAVPHGAAKGEVSRAIDRHFANRRPRYARNA